MRFFGWNPDDPFDDPKNFPDLPSSIISGTNGKDILIGTNDADSIYGKDGNDTLYGYGGNDKLYGGNGWETLIGGRGADRLDGGAGWGDTASYITSAYGVTVNLTTGTASGGDANGDTLISIERLAGSNAGDTLTGNGVGNVLDGNGGADRLFGLGGVDYIYGGTGNDQLEGGADSDFLFGEEGDDFVQGGDGNDTVVGGANNDFVVGNAGNDGVYGGTGHDIIRGGRGEDGLYGGEGLDRFVAADISRDEDNGSDTIYDFDQSSDVINFRFISGASSFSGLLERADQVGNDVILSWKSISDYDLIIRNYDLTNAERDDFILNDSDLAAFERRVETADNPWPVLVDTIEWF